jgi:hypothetical protein
MAKKETYMKRSDFDKVFTDKGMYVEPHTAYPFGWIKTLANPASR